MPISPQLAPFAWSLLLAAGVVVFSIVPLGAARSQANFQMPDLAAPRAMFDRLPTWGSAQLGRTKIASRPSPFTPRPPCCASSQAPPIR